MTRAQSFDYHQELEPHEMFDIKDVKIQIPEPARIFDSYECESCGETAGENWIRIRNGKKLRIDCTIKYNRFDV